MSKTNPVTENPNDKQSPGRPLRPDEVAPAENNGSNRDGNRPLDEEEDAKVGGPMEGP